MARKKVKLAWITNDSARRATFKKRKKGLMKKVSELSTLCGVNACSIIYSPYDSQPDVWPTPSDAHRVLTRFKSLPEMEQSKKMMNQEGFLRQRITKLKEQLRKQQKENREHEITQLMFQTLANNHKGLFDVGLEDLSDLAWMLEEKMKGIQERMDLLKKTSTSTNTITNHPQLVFFLKEGNTKFIKRVEVTLGTKRATKELQRTTTRYTTNPPNDEHHPQLVGDQHQPQHHHHQQQQQLQHGFGGGGGGAHQVSGGTHHDHQEEKMGLDLAMEALKKESWFMDVMNSHEHITCGGGGGGGEDYVMPSYYGDNSTWPSTFFP